MTPSVVMDRPRGVEADERAREAEWRSQRSRRRLRVALVLLVLLVLAAGVVAVVWFSSLFATTRVVVSGNRVLTDQEVRTAARVGLGRPLAQQDLAGEARSVATLPPVRTVTVSREWPHTVRIAVTERAPLLAVRQSAGFLLVDDQGVGFRSVPAVPHGVLQTTVDPADRADLTSAGMVAAALPPSLQSKVRQLTMAGPHAITLRLRDGDSVFWGGTEQSSLKAAVVRRLLEQPGHVYDVSAPLNPSRR